MKIRFAVAPVHDPSGGFGPETHLELFDALEDLGFDTVWLSDVPLTAALDPVAGLAAAAARTTRLKLGANVVPFGRNPFLLALTLAQLDRLSGGRVLLSLVPGIDQPGERTVLGLGRADRGRLLDQVIPVLRALWAGDEVTHDSRLGEVPGLRLPVLPVQTPLEIWLGGSGPRALERVGRLADGWLGAALTPAEAGDAVRTIREVADAAGRVVDDDHFGLSVPYSWTEPDARMLGGLRARRPDADPRDLLPVGADGLRRLVEGMVAAGVTKFVLRPTGATGPSGTVHDELARLAEVVLPLQT